MAHRAPPPALRRLICGLLLTGGFLALLVLWISTARGTTTNQEIASLLRVWSFASLLAMAWAVVYFEKENRFIRIVLVFSALLFAIVTFQVHSFSTTDSSETIPSDSRAKADTGNQSKSSGTTVAKGKTAASGKIADQIIGRWQVVGSKETSEFFKDGSILGKDDNGEPVFARYVFLDSKRFQIFLSNGVPKKPYFMTDLSITGDTLTMTNSVTGGPVSYTRLQSPNDKADLAGTWRESSGETFVISIEGSFYFDVDVGLWNWTGAEFVAKSLAKNGATWRLKLSSDGDTLSGPWSTPNGKTGTVSMTRHPRFAKLADNLIGKWQWLEHADTIEFRADGTVSVRNEEKTINLNWAVPDETHVQLSLKGVSKPPLIWTIVSIEENGFRLRVSDDKLPATYARVN